MGDLCAQFKISYHNSAPYQPKMNGVAKVANENIKTILQQMTDTCKSWHEILHSIRTSMVVLLSPQCMYGSNLTCQSESIPYV